MNNKMSIERIADRLDTLAEITPNKGKMALERIADSLDTLVEITPDRSKMSLERIADAVENYSGGGGSSDFSTATVTLICNASSVSASIAIARDAELPFIPTPQADGGLGMESGDESTVTAILYKGVSHCYFDGASSVVGTGDVEVVRDVEAYITGDCTITIS